MIVVVFIFFESILDNLFWLVIIVKGCFKFLRLFLIIFFGLKSCLFGLNLIIINGFMFLF